MEALLHQRVETGDRLVQDQQLGVVHERLDQADLLAIAGRELANRTLKLGVKTLRERVPEAAIDTPAKFCEVVEHLSPGQLRVKREIAGEKADSGANLQALLARVEPEHRR
jgi:hypothetical protein